MNILSNSLNRLDSGALLLTLYYANPKFFSTAVSIASIAAHFFLRSVRCSACAELHNVSIASIAAHFFLRMDRSKVDRWAE